MSENGCPGSNSTGEIFVKAIVSVVFLLVVILVISFMLGIALVLILTAVEAIMMLDDPDVEGWMKFALIIGGGVMLLAASWIGVIVYELGRSFLE